MRYLMVVTLFDTYTQLCLTVPGLRRLSHICADTYGQQLPSSPQSLHP